MEPMACKWTGIDVVFQADDTYRQGPHVSPVLRNRIISGTSETISATAADYAALDQAIEASRGFTYLGEFAVYADGELAVAYLRWASDHAWKPGCPVHSVQTNYDPIPDLFRAARSGKKLESKSLSFRESQEIVQQWTVSDEELWERAKAFNAAIPWTDCPSGEEERYAKRVRGKQIRAPRVWACLVRGIDTCRKWSDDVLLPPDAEGRVRVVATTGGSAEETQTVVHVLDPESPEAKTWLGFFARNLAGGGPRHCVAHGFFLATSISGLNRFSQDGGALQYERTVPTGESVAWPEGLCMSCGK